MPLLKIALLQMSAHGSDQDANLRKGDQFCRQAAAQSADIALFPEMWNIGCTAYHDKVWEHDYNPLELDEEEHKLRFAWQAQAIGPEDEFVLHFRRLAKELDMAIALTYLEKWPEAPRNSVSLINRHGEIALTYAKVHTCDFSLEAACTPGEEFYVCDLDTRHGPVKTGCMICYDREFPESARVLMLKGAEVILVPNSCDSDPLRLAQFRARAYENMVAMAMTNYAAPDQDGHSLAVHPMAFDKKGRPQDILVIEAGDREGVYIAEFDLDALRDYRNRETWGNAYRKPRAYAILTSEEVSEPFIRKDARR
jgi:N-carbamoylputrescine amidase